MARRHRVRIAGLSQHVTQRGNNRSDIFKDTQDYEAFLMVLGYALWRHPVDLHGYALMRNHVHLLLTPREGDAVERLMQLAGSLYVQYFNRRYRRTGGLFDGRYRPTIIDTDVYWLRCLRYVELNPVRARLVSRPEAYRWSSYHASGLGHSDRLITPHPLYKALGPMPAERQRLWREFCELQDSIEELEVLRKAFHAGGALGRLVIRDARGGDEP